MKDRDFCNTSRGVMHTLSSLSVQGSRLLLDGSILNLTSSTMASEEEKNVKRILTLAAALNYDFL